MPTLRQRYTLTETDELARALDAAALLWPEDRGDRAALLRRLVRRGSEGVTAAAEDRLAARRVALRALSGSLPGVYQEGARRDLLEEWPE
ncbi:MAG: hypothetical protein QM604_00335 [Microbacterium sp.]